MFHLFGQLFFGLIVGASARLVMSGRTGGVIITAILGLAGSMIGTFFGHALFGSSQSAGWLLSILGAVSVLAIYRFVAGSRPQYGSDFNAR
jgi:uncharacterized membrane protein YeaQ/YmgE (transglycosylase-associated protein family)